jgi:hypothetical protein
MIAGTTDQKASFLTPAFVLNVRPHLLVQSPSYMQFDLRKCLFFD